MAGELPIRVHRLPGTFPDAEIWPLLQSIALLDGVQPAFELVDAPTGYNADNCLDLVALPQWSARSINLFLLPGQAQRYVAHPQVHTLVGWNPEESFLSQYVAQVVPTEGSLDLSGLLLERAQGFLREEKFGPARECFTAALRIWPDSFKATFGLGRVNLLTRDFQGAEFWFRRALQVEPSPKVFSQLGRSLAGQKRWEEAIECARRGEKESWFDHKALGQYLLEAGHLVEAEACLREVVRAHLDSVYCWLELARAYRLLDRPEDEQKTLQFAVKCDPQNKYAWAHLARVCFKLNDSEGCLEAARKAIALGDDSTSMHELLLRFEAKTTLTSEGVVVEFASHTPKPTSGLETLAEQQPDQADLLRRAAEMVKEVAARDQHGPPGYQAMPPNPAPGLDALDAALFPIYGGRKPLVYGSNFLPRRGGLEGISVYARQNPDHWHFITYGLTELGEKRSRNPDFSGWGLELTFRVSRDPEQAQPGDEEHPPAWALQVLQAQADYVFRTGNPFQPGHYIHLKEPLASPEAALTALAFAADPELPGSRETPNGSMEFVQMVGITEDEFQTCQAWNTRGFLEVMQQSNPLLITRVERASIVPDPMIQAQLQAGMQRDGSKTGTLFTELLSVTSGRIEISVPMAEELRRILFNRIGFGRPLKLIGPGSARFTFLPGEVCRREPDGLTLTPDAAVALVQCLQPRPGIYKVPAIEKFEFQVAGD